MNQKLVKKLESERMRRIRQASESLLEGNTGEAKQNLEWIATAAKIIEDNQKKPDKFVVHRIAIILLIVCIFVISVLSLVKLRKVNVVLDVEVNSVTMQLMDAWKPDAFFASVIALDNVAMLQTSSFDVKEAPFSVFITGKNTRLNNISFSKAAELTLQTTGTQTDWYIKNDSLHGNFDIEDARVKIITPTTTIDTVVSSIPPETFTFATGRAVGVPIHIGVNDSATFQLRDIPVATIRFLREITPASGKFESSVLRGTIRVLETEQVIELPQGDRLFLSQIVAQRCRITKTGDKLLVHLEAQTKHLKVGPAGFEKNLIPAIIEYFYLSKRIEFLWSALMFLLGLLWSLKKTFF